MNCGENEQQDPEDMELEQNREQPGSLNSRLLRMFTYITSLHIGTDASGDSDNFDGWPKVARFHTIYSCAKHSCCSRRIVFISVLGLRIVLVLQFLVAVGSFKHNSLVEYAKLFPSKTKTTKSTGLPEYCALSNETYGLGDERTRSAKIRELSQWSHLLDLLGGPYRTSIGFNDGLFQLPIVIVGALLLVGYIRRNWSVRLNCLTFIYEPLRERKRMRLQVNNLIRTIVGELELRRHKLLAGDHSAEQPLRTECYFPYTFLCTRDSDSRNQFHIDRTLDDDNHLIEVLKHIEHHELIKPACVSLATLKLVQTLRRKLMQPVMLGSLVMGLSFPSLCLLLDLYNRTSYRLKSLECTHSYNQSTLVNHYVRDNPLTRDETSRYLEYDGSMHQFVYLMLLVEAPNLLTASLLGHVTTTYIGTISAFWQSIFMQIAGIETTYYICWIEQILDQMHKCNELLHMNHHQRLAGRLFEPIKTKLACKTMVAFVNFECFRRNYALQQSFLNHMYSQYTIINIAATTCTYLIGSHVKSEANILIIMATNAFITSANLFILLGARAELSVSRVFRASNKLLAMVSGHGLELTPWVGYWRRETACEHDIRSTMVPQVFGLKLTRGAHISLNLYVLAMWLYLTRH